MALSYKQNFLFSIFDLPKTQFNVTNVNIPNISLGMVEQPTSYIKIPRPGDQITYSPLTFTALIDENFNNYIEIYNWMNSFQNNTNKNYADLKDASLIILNNNKNELFKVNFQNVWVTDISDISFSIQESSTPQTMDITLIYSQFKIVMPG